MNLAPADESRTHSQNGEDGVLQAIFSQIGATNRYAVEIGAGPEDCKENNTNLLKEHGWTVLQLDTQRGHRVTPANVATFLASIPSDFDLLSIDVDGQDYWIWQAIPHRPRVVVIVYNAALGAEVSTIVAEDEDAPTWNGSIYFGASLQAYVRLANRLGYTLVYCESSGTNAFFVRSDILAAQLFRRGFHVWPKDDRPWVAGP